MNGIFCLKLVQCHGYLVSTESFSNHGNRDLWPGQRGLGQISPCYPSTSLFCVPGLIIFFQYHVENFFHYYFKVSIICDEYIRYWNNGMCLSNQVNGSTRIWAKKAPGTWIRVNSSPPSAAYMRQWTGSALAQIMACRLFGTKPLSKPMLAYCQLDPEEQTSVKF